MQRLRTSPARRVAIVLASLGVVAAASRQPLFASDAFLRGDSNGDGRVSISDVHAAALFLFAGGDAGGCAKTVDVNDDGQLDTNDLDHLLAHLVRNAASICTPYPEIGEDPSEDAFECRSYGGGAVLPDENATLSVGDVVVDGGEATLTLIASHSTPVAAYWARIGFERAIFAEGQSGVVTPLTGFSDVRGAATAVVRGGAIHVAVVVDRLALGQSPGDDVAIAEVTVCLNVGSRAGVYELSVEDGEFADALTGRAIVPSLGSASLTLESDLRVGEGCVDGELPDAEPCVFEPPPPPPPPATEFLRGDVNTDGRVSISDALHLRRFLFVAGEQPSCKMAADANGDDAITNEDLFYLLSGMFEGGPMLPSPFPMAGPLDEESELDCLAYQVTEPRQTGDVVALGNGSLRAGETVDIPVRVTSSVDVDAVQLVLRVDPPVLEPQGLVFDGTLIDGLDPSVNGGVFGAASPLSEGVFTVGFAPSLVFERPIPAGESTLAFLIRAHVSTDVEQGVTVILGPADEGGDDQGAFRLRNELSFEGSARFVSVEPRVFAGFFQVVADLTFFFRGDANADGLVDLSDPIRLLGFLSLGAPPLDCEDAGDANDDGALDLSDAIYLLEFLFRSGDAPPDPFGDRGSDPTDDSLHCFDSSEE